jgi:beta-fructofuranosidase
MYVLAISVSPRAPLGGSVTQYFPGTFDGTTFTPVDDSTRLIDFAKDNYAGQFFYGIPETEEQVFMSWATGLQYCQDVPTGDAESWVSTMTVPRKSYLAEIGPGCCKMVSGPYNISAVFDS